MNETPSYLYEYAKDYAKEPRQAAVAWFTNAKFGLFLHYGLYALLGRHEWVQYREKIPVNDYAKLKNRFKAGRFDADAICDVALDAGMKYINLTTRHHDSFCLWETQETDFHSVNSPCGRDLVGELADACRRRALGLCLYYSHGRDWKHPHAPNNDRWGGAARPEYDPPDPNYAYGDEHDLGKYVDFMKAQITELLTHYGPIAAIWLDGIGVPLNDKTREPCPQPPNDPDNAPDFRVQELYDHIHSLQPQVLVSYKGGLLGTEDFYAPEHKALDRRDKPGEVCTTMCREPINSWGYLMEGAGRHVTPTDVWEDLTAARKSGFNLLLNTGPLPDGEIDAEDHVTLREVGARIRREGFPGE